MKHIAKGFVAVLVIGCLLGVGWWRYNQFLTQGMRPTEGTQKLNAMEKEGVPQFTLEAIDGRKVALSDYADKTVIISFWASWCDPCVQEFPSMVKLVEAFKGQVVMLAISADRSIEDIHSFLKPYGERLPKDVIVMWDKEQKLANSYGTEALPESYILSKGLKLVRKVSGSENWFSPGAIELFEQITGTKVETKGSK